MKYKALIFRLYKAKRELTLKGNGPIPRVWEVSYLTSYGLQTVRRSSIQAILNDV